MKWFKNAEIKKKLIISFVLIALLAGVIGTMGIYNMNKLNGRTKELYYDRLIPVVDLSQVQKNLYIMRSNFLLLIHERNESQNPQLISEINKLHNENTELLMKYGQTKLNENEENYLQHVNDEITVYARHKDDIIGLIQTGNYNDALKLYTEFVRIRIQLDGDLSNLVNENIEEARIIYNRNISDFKTQLTIMIVIVIIGMSLAVGLGLLISSLISKPIGELVQVSNKIADGDLDVNIDIETKDEIGVLAQAFRRMTEKINDVMSNINSAAEQVAAGSKQVSDSSMGLSQGATEQASSIEELTASLEEISAQTRLNAESATEANNLAELAKSNAVLGNSQMKEMLGAMEGINDSSSSISKIIKVIDEIAFQTNILALNAAVEAARAGQHGKGFAVVAEEVRNLAARSANAAKETTTMIEGSIKKVEEGTRIANDTAIALNTIVDGVAKVANLVSDIAIASNEQAAAITQINQGIMQVSEVVQTNSATSEESAAASEELASQAELLNNQVARFKLKRSYQTGNYKGLEELNPEVLRVLENMNNKNKYSSELLNQSVNKKTKNIVLSDKEFGKY
ncbi:methyl-accepting chemotaxis protein [Serpentinicella alkaliphila]|uniref:Methyl-accepting chemotaxis sensory transducer n=1 Tax=Serpentinicella alkaliphila TaxID=1734049 RepID=A0A4R2T793_9FIRM|nr:methyl-accepting chemotaxis protein [Serpentinicella alkaliphila]QUH25571.1 methyl-accepting chemotaxis protein [Serpentinicella alkaliphila]TCP97376.1 methyl-accepting chemotaxis sensory transducer [Serpentinicella alkaliphila]